MALRDEDVQRIGEYVKPWLRGYVAELVPTGPTPVQTQLLERILRVEEELRLQRELMEARFHASDKRFDAMQATMDQRFETAQSAMDQRFESMQSTMDERFKTAQSTTDERFESMQTFNRVCFESADKRFDDAQRSFARMQWLIGIGFVMVTVVVSLFGIMG